MAATSMSRQMKRLASFLAERRGQFVSRAEILANVFDRPAYDQTRTVDTHVQKLLNLLGDDEEIITARSRMRHGYILATRPGGEI